MCALYTEDTIRVQTETGECKIDLCFGDITSLKKEEAVDVCLVSAFPGDYAATPTSLIGAFQKNLGLSVRELSRDKEEDLRRLYCCWWSRPLPQRYPFRRILCFESTRYLYAHPVELVGDVFRCLVPILRNQDGQVITPLLATGDQGYSETVMLKGMIDAAVNWMKAGLPLRLLKIVVFTRSVKEGKMDSANKKHFKGILSLFTALKEQYESKEIEEKVTIEFDVYISYSEKDLGVVDTIQGLLMKEKKDIKIFSEQQDLDTTCVWQENMYKVMVKCAKIITVLSPAYLTSATCTEQYNIALCVNRKTNRDRLAPFYVEQIELLPSYMGLVQYVNCSPHDKLKLATACHQVIVALTLEVTMVTQKGQSIKKRSDLNYDVFISYSHKNSQQATAVLNKLTNLNPDLKIFFDKEELKTGMEKTMDKNLYYHGKCCLEKTGSHIDALIIFLQSDLQLIVLCLEHIEDIAEEFTSVKMVDGFRNDFHSVVDVTYKSNNQLEIFQKSKDEMYADCNIAHLTEEYRLVKYRSKYGNKDTFTEIAAAETDLGNKSYDIILSYAPSDAMYAKFFRAVIRRRAPSLKLIDAVSTDHRQMAVLDSASVIVPLISPAYVESNQVVELQIALSRHRLAHDESTLFPILLNYLPQKPTYFHLLPYEVSCVDEHWREQVRNDHFVIPDVGVTLGKAESSLLPAVSKVAACALMKAVDILLLRLNRQQPTMSGTQNVVLCNVVKLRHEILATQNAEFVARAEKFLLDSVKETETMETKDKTGESSSRLDIVDRSVTVEESGTDKQTSPPSERKAKSGEESNEDNWAMMDIIAHQGASTTVATASLDIVTSKNETSDESNVSEHPTAQNSLSATPQEVVQRRSVACHLL
ncbi:uncharacterized protein LOC100375438 [Saccoglossus kowalevskii]